MTRKIIFFTASNLPTAEEKAAIAALKPLTEPPYEVVVRNAQQPMTFNADESYEATDFVAGAVPAEYAALPTFDIPE